MSTKTQTPAEILEMVTRTLGDEIQWRVERVQKWQERLAATLLDPDGDTAYSARWGSDAIVAAAEITELRAITMRLARGESLPALVASLRAAVMSDVTTIDGSDSLRGMTERASLKVRARWVENLEGPARRFAAATTTNGEG